MYIQDDKQMIRGNLDIPGNWNESYLSSQMGTIVMILPTIGTFVTYEGKSYAIMTVTTYQEEGSEPDKAVITTICRILPIDDEGDDCSSPDNPPISVKADELTLI